MKHLKKEPKKKKTKQIHRLKILLAFLLIALAGAAITIYRDYMARPGFLEKIWIADRGADYITVAWERPRNVYKYVITYGGKSVEVPGRKKSTVIEGLNEDTDYEFSVRADSKDRKGFETLTAKAKTKKASRITGEEFQMKFARRPVDLKQTAETQIKYLPGNGYSVNAEGIITFNKAGEVVVKAKTEASEEYASTEKEIKVEVLDTVDADISNASPHVFYKLNKENCECVMTIKGTKEATIPQSFAYDKGKYVVAYINNEGSPQRVVSFGGEKEAYEPGIEIGHANGFTLADGTGYTVRGGGSKTCIAFDSPSSNYRSFDLAFGASGIAYDETYQMFYTTSRNKIIVYDKSFNVVKSMDRISRDIKYGVQDCGAYGGLLMHCISGENVQGTNYIDFYDITNSKYVGSIECELNEVESLAVDEEGYIVLMCNVMNLNDNIWKTPINIRSLCE